jgi:hypothetical protein
MDNFQNILALSLGAGWASGINLYAATFMLGLLGATGNLDLPAGLEILANPIVLVVTGVMYLIEFLTDKIPGVDTLWDSIHTFIRIPAGAVLASGAVGELGTVAELAAGLMGGTLAAGSHATKAGSRVVMNTSPEPFSNWTASISEDVAVFAGLWAALNHPWVFLSLLALFILLMVWLLPKLWWAIKQILSAIGRFFGRIPEKPE